MKTKFQNLLLITLCFFSILSCSKDDGPSSVDLDGTWILTSLKIESAFDFNGDGTATNDLVVETNCHEDDFIEVNEDGTVRIVSGLTFISVDGNFNPTHQCLSEADQTTTFTQNGNVLTVENGSNDFNATISGNTITATLVDTFTLQVYNGTDVVSDSQTMILTYVKL